MEKLKKKILFRNINEKIIWESENIFHLFSDVSRYGKILSHYEVYKKIKDLPGDIMELGVFKGVSFNQFLTFRNLLEYSKSRKIFGFDSFGQFPKPQNKIDNKFFKEWKNIMTNSISDWELNNLMKKKGFENFYLIKGDIFKTLNKFLNEKKNLKISLLHLDLDVYDVTLYSLKKLYEKVVYNGIILLDDYGIEAGATKAVDIFFKNRKVAIQKFHYHDHGSFIIKQE